MQAVLITLGILGFGAVLISIYVFTVAARRYVHERVDDPRSRRRSSRSSSRSSGSTEKLFITRSGRERRQNVEVTFPLKLASGEIILADRRRGERRQAA